MRDHCVYRYSPRAYFLAPIDTKVVETSMGAHHVFVVQCLDEPQLQKNVPSAVYKLNAISNRMPH